MPGDAPTGLVDPTAFITRHADTVVDAIEAYRSFDHREEFWLKTVLDVS